MVPSLANLFSERINAVNVHAEVTAVALFRTCQVFWRVFSAKRHSDFHVQRLRIPNCGVHDCVVSRRAWIRL